jgi:hypothetical protein
MTHREAPSCNGSQQESQKLTGDAAGETPRTDAAEFDWSIIQGREYKTKRVVSAGFARQLERESSSLKAQLEGFRKDAERYRWLRNSHNQGANSPQGEGVMVVTDRPSKEPRYIGPLAWQLLDRAIDSALHHDTDR